MLLVLSKEHHKVGTSSNRDRYGAKPNKQPNNKDHIVMIVFVNTPPMNELCQDIGITLLYLVHVVVKI